jgi:GMP synthase (glutamine-hydrolysing)
MSGINHKKVLLLSIRREQETLLEEYHSFARYSGLDPEQIDLINAFQTPDFEANSAEQYSGLFIGGASEASVLEPDLYPFVINGQALIRNCIDNDIPVFASCFGFQLAVLALGGEIIRDKINFEMGTVPIALTPDSVSDPLLRDTPSGFLAVSVHQEKALELPPGCEQLAETDDCIHAFRVTGKPFWAFQFHPEVDRSTLVSRLTVFKDRYTDDDDHLDKIISSAQETPESNLLVKKFVDRIL